MAPAADIDLLIEEGLNRYGAGDLDGALMAWEEALAFDPHNPQLNSYVDYLRNNYELLADSNIGLDDDDGSFELAEEPDYIIEILPGEPSLEAADAPAYLDPLDEGWFIEEEATRDFTRELGGRDTREGIPAGMADTVMEAARTISADLPPQHFELEADEPPGDIELPAPVRPSDEAVTFESSTREYGRENEFEETPSSFTAEATPLGFGSMETEVKKRELGFVQPTHGSARLEIRVRTPTSPPTGRLGSAPVATDASDPAELELQLGGAGRNDDQRTPHGTMRGLAPVVRQPALGEDDTTLALPQRDAAPAPSRTIVPRRQSGSQSVAGNEPTDPGPVDPGAPTGEQPRIITRDLPGPRRPASIKDGDDVDDIALPTASTRDLDPRRAAADAERLGLSTDDPFIASAPTKELGLRPGGRPPSVYPDEDAPTRQSDARAIREHNTAKLKPEPANRRVSPGDGTAHDLVLPFDPIDARSSGILEGLDDDAPAEESKEDRTRRRITLLLQRALAWNTEHDVDRAVTAVDLALNEDPNSALAQKLIHRNRETIMAVFQEYLGDLERQPQLTQPLHELASAPISPRAAFLLSRIDGHLTVDEILDVSGMPRMEAYRHLCQLFLRGILR